MRITGGVWRSRTLRAPRGVATRPTSDRVREALFSILVSEGAFGEPAVLDLYAGSGSLGFEALSRGARRAVFVESAKDAVACIRDNLRALEADARASILPMRVEAALAKAKSDEAFDLVFADPPYKEVPQAGFGEVLGAAAKALADGGILVLEHASTDRPPTISGLDLDKTRRYGDTSVSLYRRV